MDIVSTIAGYIRPYNTEIAVALVATFLVIFGGKINEMVRTLVKEQLWAVRVLVFILLCAFGYGMLTVWLTPILAGYLRGLSHGMYILQVGLAFLIIGVVAERGRWK